LAPLFGQIGIVHFVHYSVPNRIRINRIFGTGLVISITVLAINFQVYLG